MPVGRNSSTPRDQQAEGHHVLVLVAEHVGAEGFGDAQQLVPPSMASGMLPIPPSTAAVNP